MDPTVTAAIITTAGSVIVALITVRAVRNRREDHEGMPTRTEHFEQTTSANLQAVDQTPHTAQQPLTREDLLREPTNEQPQIDEESETDEVFVDDEGDIVTQTRFADGTFFNRKLGSITLAAKEKAEELKVPLSVLARHVTGSGAQGRITVRDVMEFWGDR